MRTYNSPFTTKRKNMKYPTTRQKLIAEHDARVAARELADKAGDIAVEKEKVEKKKKKTTN